MSLAERELGARIAARLTTAALGRPLFVVDRTTSTMDEARLLWRAGAPAGTTVVALQQDSGRGRLGRPFVSPLGGLYLTVLVTLPGPIDDAWRLGFVAALAARDALVEHGASAAVQFDWPNDLVLSDRKVGGVLCELLTAAAAQRLSTCVAVGIGLNLGPEPAEVDPERAGPAGALPALPIDEPLAAVAAAFLGRLEARVGACATMESFRSVLESMRRTGVAALGRPVRLRLPDGGIVEGRGTDIRDDGSLVIQRSDGSSLAVRLGERDVAGPFRSG